jgi:hypothetical protein
MRPSLLLMSIIFATAVSTFALELDPQALAAWDGYLATIKTQMQARLTGAMPFLWIDQAPGRAQRLKAGEIIVSPLARSNPVPVSHGLLHHWIGAVFVPGATIQDLADVVSDYSAYNQIYRPTIVKAELLGSTAQEQTFSILWVQRVLFATEAFHTEFNSSYVPLNGDRGYRTFFTTSIQQIEHYGERDERKLPVDEGSGYVWRLATFVRFEQRDGGLYLEMEVLGLSRDLPRSLQLLLGPIISHIPREALAAKLGQTREAIRSRAIKH